MEFIRASVAELFTQSRQFWHGKGVTPFVDVSLLDLTHLSINESISLIEKIHAKTQTQAQNAKVCLNLSSSNTSTSHGQMAMYHLQNIADKDHKLKLLNIYKGLSVASAGKVEKIVDGDIYVQTEKLQKYLMHTEKNVVIQSDYIPMDIAAEVKYVDSEQPYAILKNPVFLESSANNRKTVRVQCSTKIAIMITGSKYAFAGEIFDLSMQAIAVRYKNKINDDIVGTDAKLSFSLPNKASEDKINRVALAGQVTAVKELDEETRVIIAVKMDPQNEKIVLEYIYSRQKELIVEIKKLGSMIFK